MPSVHQIVPLFGMGWASKSVNVTAQRRTNLYLEPQKEPDKGPLAIYGTPGLTKVFSTGDAPIRGAISLPDGNIYYVAGSQVFQINPTGSINLVMNISSATGPVSMAWNTLQLALVDGAYGFCYTPATGVATQIVAAWMPPNPTTITFLNGYFIVNQGGTGKFFWSAAYDALSGTALNFATAESATDNLMGVYADHGQLVLAGERTTEFWAGSGDSGVWARVGGTGVEWGVAAIQSVAKFADGLIFLAKNRLGEAQVVYLQGYQAQSVSDPEISHYINGLRNLRGAVAFSYLMDGHNFYQINFDSVSLLYDGLSQSWSKLDSGAFGSERGRHYANGRVELNIKPYVYDYRNGNIYLLDKNNYADNGDPIVRELVGRHTFDNLDLLTLVDLFIDIEEGVGLPVGQGSDPQIMLQISKDGGHTWGAERWRSMGKIGEYLTRVIWRKLGRCRDFVVKLKMSDPVKFVLINAAVKVQQ